MAAITAPNNMAIPKSDPEKCRSRPSTTIKTPIKDTTIPKTLNTVILSLKNKYATKGVKTGMVDIITADTVDDTILTP